MFWCNIEKICLFRIWSSLLKYWSVCYTLWQMDILLTNAKTTDVKTTDLKTSYLFHVYKADPKVLRVLIPLIGAMFRFLPQYVPRYYNLQNDLCVKTETSLHIWSVLAVGMNKLWVLGYPKNALWRLNSQCRCAGWLEFLLGAHIILYKLPKPVKSVVFALFCKKYLKLIDQPSVLFT